MLGYNILKKNILKKGVCAHIGQLSEFGIFCFYNVLFNTDVYY